MEAFGNIGTEIKKIDGKPGKKPFFAFRVGENHGKEPNRTTTWYDVTAFISELEADMLSKGMFVKIIGRLEVKPYSRNDGSPAAELRCLAYKVEPIESNKPAQGGEAQSGPDWPD